MYDKDSVTSFKRKEGTDMKKLRTWNPYLASYLSFAMLCCIVLSTVFLYLNLKNTRENEKIHNQEKLCLVTEDWENQLETFQKMTLQIAVNRIYQPFYFQMNKYYEISLLNDFVQYRNYSPIVDESFLYYQNEENIFHSDSYTINLDVYLNNLSDTERKDIKDILAHPENMVFYSLDDKIFIFLPVSTMAAGNLADAMLCTVIDNSTLYDRIQTVSGGLNGSFALYCDSQLLYTNDSQFSQNRKNTLSASTDNGAFTFYYTPSEGSYAVSSLLPLQILLVIAGIILVLFIASLFAYHSYKPIMILTQKYRKKVPLEQESHFANELEEINFMLESIINNNIAANTMLEQKQNILRSQLLISLLNGKYSFNIQSYLAQVKLTFPGPYYFVISISFSKEDMPGAELFLQLKELFEEMSDVQESKYIYAVIETEQKMIHCICSIPEQHQWNEIYVDIKELAESFGHLPMIGYGNVYTNLSNLSASYLEALDNIHKVKTASTEEAAVLSEFSVSQPDLYQICNALSVGNEEAAMESLAGYVAFLEQTAPSLLMQQYLFTNFLSEITRVFHEYHIELSKQSISLIISAKNISQFSDAARALLHDFCVQFGNQKARLLEEGSYQVYQYINEHFTDYELSIENVAVSLNTSTVFVRNAIREHTGKSYKDYLIYLRMEYAKELLTREKLTVAETCQRVGYSNISYFIKAFKAQTGVTPANYKNGNQPE